MTPGEDHSNAVTKGFRKPHGVALGLVHRAENRCKSSGAPGGACPRTPRGRVGPRSGPKSTISRSSRPPKTLKTMLTALEPCFKPDTKGDLIALILLQAQPRHAQADEGTLGGQQHQNARPRELTHSYVWLAVGSY